MVTPPCETSRRHQPAVADARPECYPRDYRTGSARCSVPTSTCVCRPEGTRPTARLAPCRQRRAARRRGAVIRSGRSRLAESWPVPIGRSRCSTAVAGTVGEVLVVRQRGAKDVDVASAQLAGCRARVICSSCSCWAVSMRSRRVSAKSATRCWRRPVVPVDVIGSLLAVPVIDGDTDFVGWRLVVVDGLVAPSAEGVAAEVKRVGSARTVMQVAQSWFAAIRTGAVISLELTSGLRARLAFSRG